MDWDKPVRTYLPEFQMNDPVASEQATPRDLFAHRTGLPRHDLVWYSSDFSREDLVGRLHDLKPNKGFRSAYQYNNLTVMTMGYLEGKLTGLGWEGCIRQKIFAPLGMSHSDLSVTEIEKTDDHALPYELKKEVVTKVPYHNIDAIGPAGSINSSVAAPFDSVAVLPGRRRGRNSGTGAVSNGRRENIGATSALQSYFWEPYLAVPAARIFAPGALILSLPLHG